MSTNKFISYLLCNKGIIINLYELHFLYSNFFFQPNKRVFHPPTFPSLQPNTHKGKLNIFHPPTFPSSHNFLSSQLSHHFTIFYPPTFPLLQLNRPLMRKKGNPLFFLSTKTISNYILGKLYFITLNYALDYIFHHKLSKCTLCTINYHTYLTLHSGVTFAVMFDWILLHMISTCFLLK